MRTSFAYFAGAGTVVVAIAVGLGGGLVIASVMNPNAGRELGKVELQMKAKQSPQPNVAQQSPQPDAAQPSPATASNAPQTPAPYLSQVQPAAKSPVVVGAAPPKPQENAQDQPKSEAAYANRPAAKTSVPPAKHDAAAAKPDDSPKAMRDDAPKTKQAEQTQPSTHDEASAPENAYAKARDADLKRGDDKRKLDRHQQWATRHQQQPDPEMRDVEEQVRRDRGPREVFVDRDDSDRPDYDRPDYDRPMRFGFPRMNFFGPDD